MGNGFTLIEMLVVITIIGIIAAMVMGLSALAARKKHDAVVTAMKNKLVLCISSYQSKMGFYPPDNAINATLPAGSNYENSTGLNPLLYELTGASMTSNNSFVTYETNIVISSATFAAAYGRGGIANSLPDETHTFYQPLPGPKDYMIMISNGLKQLVVPVGITLAPNEFNPWHYDSSSTNRHNSSTFDLWAEYSVGNDTNGNPNIITNGNW